MLAITDARANPPLIRPTKSKPNLNKRGVSPPDPIISPAKTKNGMQVNVKMSMPVNIFCGTVWSGTPVTIKASNELIPNAQAMGTPNIIVAKTNTTVTASSIQFPHLVAYLNHHCFSARSPFSCTATLLTSSIKNSMEYIIMNAKAIGIAI
jgi:hypothetical protein